MPHSKGKMGTENKNIYFGGNNASGEVKNKTNKVVMSQRFHTFKTDKIKGGYWNGL